MGLAPIFFSARKVRYVVELSELNGLLVPVIEELGLEFVGIDFNPSQGSSLLRVYIDAPDRPVIVEDCERVSREISALLDVHDPMTGRYTLEVSSPGIDRPLFTLAHFNRFIAHVVKLSVSLPVNGRRRFQGVIRQVQGDVITLDQDDTLVAIEHANVQRARLVPDYTALGFSAEGSPAQKGAAKPPRKTRKT